MTLAEKYGAAPGDQKTGLVKHWNEVIEKDIDQLDVKDVAMLIRQNAYLNEIIPIALSMLKKNPLDGYYYDGELLCSFTYLDSELFPFKNKLDVGLNEIEGKLELIQFENDDDKKEYENWIDIIRKKIT